MHQRHEANGLEPLTPDSVRCPHCQHQVLAPSANRRDEPSSHAQLRLERVRNLVAGCRGNVDGIERRQIREAVPAVPDEDLDVLEAEAANRLLRARRKLRVAFDRPHMVGQERQQGGVVSRPGADIEDAITGFRGEHLEHPGDDERLRDRLAAGDRQRNVVIRPRPLAVGDEALPWNRCDRCEHSLVGDPGSQSLGEHR